MMGGALPMQLFGYCENDEKRKKQEGGVEDGKFEKEVEEGRHGVGVV